MTKSVINGIIKSLVTMIYFYYVQQSSYCFYDLQKVKFL